MDKRRKTITGDCAISTPGTETLSWGLTRKGDVSDSSGDPDPAPGHLCRERCRTGPLDPPLPRPRGGRSYGPHSEPHREQTGARAQRGSGGSNVPPSAGWRLGGRKELALTEHQLSILPFVLCRPFDSSLSVLHLIPAARGALLLKHLSVCCWKKFSHLQTQVLTRRPPPP